MRLPMYRAQTNRFHVRPVASRRLHVGTPSNPRSNAMLVKDYGTDPNEGRRFSPPVILSQSVRVVTGNPDPAKISTSYVERSNLTMRMGMRRFTRLTNAFSKKVENLSAAVALHFMYYNFGRVHQSLANPYPRTPAMAAGLADHIWTCEEIAALLD